MSSRPALGRGTPSSLFPTLVHSPPHLLLFLLFPFSFSRLLYRFSSFVHPVPFSTRIVQLCFQAGGRRRRPNLGLVCSVYLMLSVLFNYDIVNIFGVLLLFV